MTIGFQKLDPNLYEFYLASNSLEPSSFKCWGGEGVDGDESFKASTRQKGKGERKKKGIRKKEVLGFEKLQNCLEKKKN